MRLCLLALAVLALAALVAGQPPSDAVDRFRLFTRCEPLSLFVEVGGGEADEIDLTEDRVRTLVESRLRAARLYRSGIAPPQLSVVISTSDPGRRVYVYRVQMSKWLTDAASGLEWYAQSWVSAAFGQHVGDAGPVLQHVSEDVDRFILEYLRVNEDSCP